MLEFKEGQTYICTETDKQWWTEGKEYEVISESYFELRLEDDEGDWYTQNSINNKRTKFELKEELKEVQIYQDADNFKLKRITGDWDIDLNKLTLDELSEYVELAKEAVKARNRVENFISYRK